MTLGYVDGRINGWKLDSLYVSKQVLLYLKKFMVTFIKPTYSCAQSIPFYSFFLHGHMEHSP